MSLTVSDENMERVRTLVEAVRGGAFSGVSERREVPA